MIRPDVDLLMIPTSKAIKKHVKDRDAITEIYNRAYEAVIISMEAKEAENATLREQLRWRLTATEKPDTGELVMVGHTSDYLTPFRYDPMLDDTFIRYHQWLPIPPFDKR